jgi:hypothetical protein
MSPVAPPRADCMLAFAFVFTVIIVIRFTVRRVP